MLYASVSKMFGRDEIEAGIELKEAQFDLQKIERLLARFGFKGGDQYILDENPSQYAMVNAFAQLR